MDFCSDVFQIDCKIIKNISYMQTLVYNFGYFVIICTKNVNLGLFFSRFVRSRFIGDIKKA